MVVPPTLPMIVVLAVRLGKAEVSVIVPTTPIVIVPPPEPFVALIASRRVPAEPSSAVEVTT